MRKKNKSQKKKNIFFVYKKMAPFVQNDIDILSAEYNLDLFQVKPLKGTFYILWRLIQQFFFLLFNIRKYHAVFVWFADYHAFFPVLFANLFRKKSFVVNGGYDVNSVPEINYGVAASPFRKNLNRIIFRKATFCLPVAKTLGENLLKIEPKANIKVVYTGHNTKTFNFDNNNRNKIVFTLANATTEERFYVKGLDRFNELAKVMPEYEFIVAGIDTNIHKLFKEMPDNLKLEGYATEKRLIELFNGASFYAQLSRTEGLPGSLCEAMLCGCIPIGMSVGDIKYIIDNIGLVCEDWDANECKNFIETNHNNKLLRINARKKIITTYSINKREKTLKGIIS